MSLEMMSRKPLWARQSTPLSSLGTKTCLLKGHASVRDGVTRGEHSGDCGRTPQATQPDVPAMASPAASVPD